MALFSVRRYAGDDELENQASENNSDKPVHEIRKRPSQELDKHLKQNRKQKRKRNNGEVESESNISQPLLTKSAENETSTGTVASESSDFTILGDFEFPKAQSVTTLPDWMKNPLFFSPSHSTSLSNSSYIHSALVQTLTKNSIEALFPVQAVVIPQVLNGRRCGETYYFEHSPWGYRPRDICCSAPTGSGKTLAYVLPIVQVLFTRTVPRTRCLVIVPVRDLAAQVHSVFSTYISGSDLKVVLLAGFTSFQREQDALLQKLDQTTLSADIVIATPGRLVEHLLQSSSFTLEHLRFLVIDEADRVVEEAKFDWLSVVEKSANGTSRRINSVETVRKTWRREIPLQKLLFSATLLTNPDQVESLNLFRPVLIRPNNQACPDDIATSTVTPETTSLCPTALESSYMKPEGLSDMWIRVEATQKPLYLIYLLLKKKLRPMLCFTNSLRSTHRLCVLLQQIGGIKSKEVSSNLPLRTRQRIFSQLNRGFLDVVVTTDILARGMDLPEVVCVSSYEPPRFIGNHIHRSGRTARAGKAGTCVTLLESHQVDPFNALFNENAPHPNEMVVKSGQLKKYLPLYTVALESLQKLLQNEAKQR